jgi:hypothetical protein
LKTRYGGIYNVHKNIRTYTTINILAITYYVYELVDFPGRKTLEVADFQLFENIKTSPVLVR